jgi:hypothetical protein
MLTMYWEIPSLPEELGGVVLGTIAAAVLGTELHAFRPLGQHRCGAVKVGFQGLLAVFSRRLPKYDKLPATLLVENCNNVQNGIPIAYSITFVRKKREIKVFYPDSWH